MNLSMMDPEEKTLIEKLVALFRVPYFIGIIFLVTILGPPGAAATVYLYTNNLSDAISKTCLLFYGSVLPLRQSIFCLSIFMMIFFYLLYMIRYMRLKIIGSKDQLLGLLNNEEETFENIFGHIAAPIPPVLIGLTLMTLYTLQFAPELPDNLTLFCSETVNLAFLVLSYPFWFITFSMFVWIFLGSIRGLYILGTKATLVSYKEDKMLGARPIGALSVSLTYTYFAGLGILAFLPSILNPEASAQAYILVIIISMIIGLCTFFFPLYTIHTKMEETKKMEQTKLRNTLRNIAEKEKSNGDTESMTDIQNAIERLSDIMSIEISRDDVNSIPTWPIDTKIINRIITMAISILGVIISQYIMRRVIFLIPS